MDNCPNKKIFNQLESSFDRLMEAEWAIGLMRLNYHSADAFRWSLNCFLRSLKEISQIIQMEIQGDGNTKTLFKTITKKLKENELISVLSEQRNTIVHKQMLKPNSSAFIGCTKGYGLKLGFKISIDPLEDSEIGLKRYIRNLARTKSQDIFGILYMDENNDNGEFSCVEREWKLKEFPTIEIIDLVSNAWELIAEALFEIARYLGADLNKPKLDRVSKDYYKLEIYDPAWVKEQFEFYNTKEKE